MKSYNGLFDKMLSEQSMRKAFLDASKGKRKRRDVYRVLRNLDDKTLPDGKVKRGEITKLRNILADEKLVLHHHEPCRINEAACQKERDIIKPYFKYEQVVHHLLVNQLKPIIMHGFYEFSCGSIPERGCHFGKRHIERWLQSYPEGQIVYVLKMDIHHFFESVDHDILKKMLSEVIRDKKFLRLLFKVIDHHDKGLPLGYYTSQWLANFYLKRFDHYVKEVLQADHYMRYMDDMIITDTDPARLHAIRVGVAEYLGVNLHLELKSNWQVFPLAEHPQDKSGRALDFMGFKFYRNCTTLRKSILFRARRKANRIAAKYRKKLPVTWKDATAMVSYMGWFIYTRTYKYFRRYIKTKVCISTMRWIVSKHSRKEQKKHDRLENRQRNAGRETRRGRWLFEYQDCVPA